MADRSPNFPSMSLGEAVEAIKKVHAAEGRSKVPRLSVAKPLGYSSINGRSLSILGALKAYGLLEGRGDELRISQEGFILANAPADSTEYREALVASFRAPSAFQRFTDEDEGASAETLKWKLQKGGFQAESAERLVRVYRESRDLVNATKGAYESDGTGEQKPDEPSPMHPVFDEMMSGAFGPSKRGAQSTVRSSSEAAPQELGMGVQERVLQSGMLSKTASYRVIVTGAVGVAEIDRLLKKIEMDKEILADADPVMPMPASGGPDPEGEAAYDQWNAGNK
jgi:hypothetical protein